MEYRIVHVYSVDEYHVEWRKYVWNKFKPKQMASHLK